MLCASDMKMLAIACVCGFQQPEYFDRLFRRRFGRSPRQYRLLGRRPLDPTA